MDDPEAFLQAHRHQLVILDEVQRQPELFAVLRSVIDQRRRDGEAAGQFLLLGSASGVLLRQTSESLAGRVAQVELGPFQLREVVGPNTPCLDMNPLWVRGGFPLSWLATDDAASLRWREMFIAPTWKKTFLRWGRASPAPHCARWTMCWATRWRAAVGKAL